MTTAQQRQALGAYGERIAARYLADLGMTVLDRNWRCSVRSSVGELDLVLGDRGDVVICEVKTRRGLAYGHPLTAVGSVKLARLRRLGLLWAEDHGLVRAPIRIDLVGVVVLPSGPALVEHVPGIC